MEEGINVPFRGMHFPVRERTEPADVAAGICGSGIPEDAEEERASVPPSGKVLQDRCVARTGGRFPDPAFDLRLEKKDAGSDDRRLFLEAFASQDQPEKRHIWGQSLGELLAECAERQSRHQTSGNGVGTERSVASGSVQGEADDARSSGIRYPDAGEEDEHDRQLFLHAYDALEKPKEGKRKDEGSGLAVLGTLFRRKTGSRRKGDSVREERSRDSTLFLRAVDRMAEQPRRQPRGFLSLEEQCPALREKSRARPGKEETSRKKAGCIQMQTVRQTPAVERAVQAPDQEDERSAFLRAVSGTTPLQNKYIAPVPRDVRTLSPRQESLAELLEGKYTFEFFCRDEYFEGFISGLDQMTVDKLRAGHLSPEAHLDLHGFVVDEAYEALRSFIRASWFKGLRTVLIVPGRGHNSIQGVGILRGRLQIWLTQEPLKRVVLAFCTAQPSDGGPGSVYVLLRRYKKKGRVNWERFSDDLWT